MRFMGLEFDNSPTLEDLEDHPGFKVMTDALAGGDEQKATYIANAFRAQFLIALHAHRLSDTEKEIDELIAGSNNDKLFEYLPYLVAHWTALALSKLAEPEEINGGYLSLFKLLFTLGYETGSEIYLKNDSLETFESFINTLNENEE